MARPGMSAWVLTVTAMAVAAAVPIHIPMSMCIPEGQYVSTGIAIIPLIELPGKFYIVYAPRMLDAWNDGDIRC